MLSDGANGCKGGHVCVNVGVERFKGVDGGAVSRSGEWET